MLLLCFYFAFTFIFTFPLLLLCFCLTLLLLCFCFAFALLLHLLHFCLTFALLFRSLVGRERNLKMHQVMAGLEQFPEEKFSGPVRKSNQTKVEIALAVLHVTLQHFYLQLTHFAAQRVASQDQKGVLSMGKNE